MAQVLKGNPGLKQAAQVPQNRAGGGMVVGAVMNKPLEVVSMPSTVPTNPIIQAQLPPGIIALAPQQAPMMAPQQALATAMPCPPPPPPPQAELTTVLATHSALANTKEKTPMCLINELARFNKIQHQYTLTDEQGPAHKKTFYVKLKLGDEEYSASGPSIKKAQHAAADIALDQTQYKHPPPKPPKDANGRWDSNSITPTVELNALAMKRGEPAVYHPVDVARSHHPQFYPPANMDFRGMYNQRYHYPRAPAIFYVQLKVGTREFMGEGRTRQAARHNAAEKALKILRNLPLPTSPAPKQAPQDKVEEGQVEEDVEEETDGLNGLLEQKDALKSEISLVHEIALKRNMPVNFEVIRESGPPHMRTFITRCTCGELVCESEGNSKKLSKKRAAERMLEKLRELPGLPPTNAVNKPKKNQGNKKKNRNLIKVEKATPDYGIGINPISRLIQIQQAKKEKEPVYTLFAERGLPRRREFVMQVTVGENTCTGVGPNKKLAKRNAAEAMLQQLGYSRPAPQPTKPAIKTASSEHDSQSGGDKKVTFIDAQPAPAYESPPQQHHHHHHHHQPQAAATAYPAHYPLSTPARQLVPGVILMQDVQRGAGTAYIQSGGNLQPAPPAPAASMKFSPQTTAAIAKELLDTGASPTAEAINKAVATTVTPQLAPQNSVRPKQQLLYLANVLGFTVSFTDFPKGNNRSDFLSLVSLSTNPPKVSHGSGPSIEASHDVAALNALRALADDGLDAVVANGSAGVQVADGGGDAAIIQEPDAAKNMAAAGDGPHIHDDGKLANSESDKKKSPETK